MNDTYGRAQLKKDLKRDEGWRNGPYKDSLGVLTIGVGRNLQAHGLSDDEVTLLLDNDITMTERDLDKHIPWWREMSKERQRVLLNMCFNMGWTGLSGFHKFLAATERGDWNEAANQMLDSRWATQVGDRAIRLAGQMRGTTQEIA